MRVDSIIIIGFMLLLSVVIMSSTDNLGRRILRLAESTENIERLLREK